MKREQVNCPECLGFYHREHSVVDKMGGWAAAVLIFIIAVLGLFGGNDYLAGVTAIGLALVAYEIAILRIAIEKAERCI